MNEFKIGDVVVLNSGGPLMTVVTVIRNFEGHTMCAWITPAGKHQASMFKAACLRYSVPRDEWNWREAGRLAVYANRNQESGRELCQDCAMQPSRPASYGIRRTLPGSRLTVVDWLHLCGPCAKARGFNVPE